MNAEAKVLQPGMSEGAAGLARRGWHVFPCLPGDKRPAIDRWEQRASADPEHVAQAWGGRYAGHNIGLACGPSRLVVVDLDCHGTLPEDWRLPGITDGRDVFAQLLEWAGQPWPVTRWSSTPSGGWHLWFTAPRIPELRNTAGQLGPMVDTRAAGGYVVVPPSVVGGRAYEWLEDRDPAPLPSWLLHLLRPRPVATPGPGGSRLADASPGRLRGLVEHVRSGQPGDRNGRLYWAACRLAELLAAGHANHADADLLVQAALDAGLQGGESEARRTVASGLRSGGSQ